jgi:hypothetical protein
MACGPTGGTTIDVKGGGSTPGFQCVELSDRFLYISRGWAPVVGNGAQVAKAYAAAYHAPLIVNGTQGVAPHIGDVMSFSNSATFSDTGHTGVVVASSVDATGRGSITLLSENVDPSGTGNYSGSSNTFSVSNWHVAPVFGFRYSEWVQAGQGVTTGGGGGATGGGGGATGGGGGGNGPAGTTGTGPIGDLGFIKLYNTGSGTVEVHWDSLVNGSYRRSGDFTSDFSPADAANGIWQLFGSTNGAPELGFIKLYNTGSGTVEVHWDTLQGGTYRRAGDFTSDFSPADAANGQWDLFSATNGVPVLGFVKVRNDGSGTVEVHWDTLQGGTYKRAGDFTSDFSPGDAGNGIWQLFGWANGAPELGFIKLYNTGSGTVEVHWDTLQGGTYKRAGDYTSDFSPADAGNGQWNLFGSMNGAPQLGFVEVRNDGSGAVEGHADALEGSTYARTADYQSDFSPRDATNGPWQIGDF